MITLAAGLAAAFAAPASVQQYVSASAGFNFQTDSDNAGAFTRDFVTGDGVAMPAGVTLPAGADVGWTMQFETGLFLAAACGVTLSETVRVEAELSYLSADVDAHEGVQAGGSALGAANAAVLITGSAPLGVTMAELVAGGRGEATSVGYALNAFYDLPLETFPVDLDLGGGLGIAEVEVVYEPSEVSIVSDKERVGFHTFMSETTDAKPRAVSYWRSGRLRPGPAALGSRPDQTGETSCAPSFARISPLMTS